MMKLSIYIESYDRLTGHHHFNSNVIRSNHYYILIILENNIMMLFQHDFDEEYLSEDPNSYHR